MHHKSHGRFPYSPITARPQTVWPNGKRLAIFVALNLEIYDFGEGLKEDIVPGLGTPDVLNYSWNEYGNRVGAWRLMELFSELEIRPTISLNSRLCSSYPELPGAFAQSGAAIVCHGRTNAEAQSGLNEAAERKLIHDARAEIAHLTGRPPNGWLGPWIAETERTPDLLQEAGFTYLLDWCMDDQPVWMTTRSGRILSVPYPQELNDSNAIACRRHTAADFADMIVAQYDEMLRQCERQPLVMSLALHAHIAGQPFRIAALRSALRHISAKHDTTWVTTSDDIATAFASLHSE